MYRRLRRVAAFLFAVIACSAFAAVAVWWRWASRAARPSDSRPVRVTVAPGAGAQSVGRDLEREGVLRSWRAFWWLGRGSSLQPGTYDFSASETPQRILARLVKGDVATVKVTFPEGFTVAQIARRLTTRGLIRDEAGFLDLVTTRGTSLKASFPPPANLEGYLFPDTYRFPVDAEPADIAQRMLDNFDRRVPEKLGDDLKKSGRPLADVVNVAAMVEREAEVDEDRPKIAGVIYNRLAKGMRLQIDATVQYARGAHKSRLLYRDLEVDSPYNTYKVSGLPAGPICCPGQPSIEAAIRPEKSDYLFYVGRPGQAHLFSRTYAEHQRNIALLRRQAAAAPAPAR